MPLVVPEESCHLFDFIRNRKFTGVVKGKGLFLSLQAPVSYNNETNWIATISILPWEGGYNSQVLTLWFFFPTFLLPIYLPLKNEKTTLLTFQDYSGITFAKALCLSYIYKHWKPDAHYSSQPSPKSWGSSFFPISTQTTAVNHREMTPEDLEYKSNRMMCTIISSNFVFQSIIVPPNPDLFFFFQSLMEWPWKHPKHRYLQKYQKLQKCKFLWEILVRFIFDSYIFRNGIL